MLASDSEGPEKQARLLADENRRLQRALEELQVLGEIATATAADQPLGETIELIVQKSIQCLGAEQGAIHLFDAAGSQKPLRTLLRQPGSRLDTLPYRLDDQLVGWVLKHKRTLRIAGPRDKDGARIQGLAESGIHSLLSAPLRVKGKLLGVLSLFNKSTPEGFSEADERVLSIIAAHSAQVIETARLIGELRQDRLSLEKENSQLWREVGNKFSTAGILGRSAKLANILRLIEQIRDTNVDVLITGESGTGKELIAKAVHYLSPRARKPFVALNCAALPENLLESELFGIEKGVATGVEKRIGQMEAADGGTLFLDEIGDLDLAAQAKILRALQERVVRRVGGREQVPVDVRIVAATNKELESEVKAGRFREDLFYRLKVIIVRVPPLRERREDIPLLANYFAGQVCRELGREPVRFAPEALAGLASLPWPGNIRELQNEVKRLVICARGPSISLADLGDPFDTQTEQQGEASRPPRPLEQSVEAFERQLLVEALRDHGGNQTETARALGMSRPGLFKKLRRYGITSEGALDA